MYLYHRVTLSLRDVEELLAVRGISVSHETIRVWCAHLGPIYAKRLRHCHGRAGDIWLLDEVDIVTVRGERRYLWRAVDHEENNGNNGVEAVKFGALRQRLARLGLALARL